MTSVDFSFRSTRIARHSRGAEFAALYNATWLRERHGNKTPDQIRADQLGLETEAATVKLAA